MTATVCVRAIVSIFTVKDFLYVHVDIDRRDFFRGDAKQRQHLKNDLHETCRDLFLATFLGDHVRPGDRVGLRVVGDPLLDVGKILCADSRDLILADIVLGDLLQLVGGNGLLHVDFQAIANACELSGGQAEPLQGVVEQ